MLGRGPFWAQLSLTVAIPSDDYLGNCIRYDEAIQLLINQGETGTETCPTFGHTLQHKIPTLSHDFYHCTLHLILHKLQTVPQFYTYCTNFKTKPNQLSSTNKLFTTMLTKTWYYTRRLPENLHTARLSSVIVNRPIV